MLSARQFEEMIETRIEKAVKATIKAQGTFAYSERTRDILNSLWDEFMEEVGKYLQTKSAELKENENSYQKLFTTLVSSRLSFFNYGTDYGTFVHLMKENITRDQKNENQFEPIFQEKIKSIFEKIYSKENIIEKITKKVQVDSAIAAMAFGEEDHKIVVASQPSAPFPDLLVPTQHDILPEPSAPPSSQTMNDSKPSAPEAFNIQDYVENLKSHLKTSDKMLDEIDIFLKSAEEEEANFIRTKLQLGLDKLVDDLGRTISKNGEIRIKKIQELKHILAESKSFTDMIDQFEKTKVEKEAIGFYEQEINLINTSIRGLVATLEVSRRFSDHQKNIAKIKLGLSVEVIYGIEKSLLSKYKELDTEHKKVLSQLEEYKKLENIKIPLVSKLEEVSKWIQKYQEKLDQSNASYQADMKMCEEQIEYFKSKLSDPLKGRMRVSLLIETESKNASEAQRKIIEDKYKNLVIKEIENQIENVEVEKQKLINKRKSYEDEIKESNVDLLELQRKLSEVEQQERYLKKLQDESTFNESLYNQYKNAIEELQNFKDNPHLFNFDQFIKKYEVCLDEGIKENTHSIFTEESMLKKLKTEFPGLDIMLAVSYVKNNGTAIDYIRDESASDPLFTHHGLYLKFKYEQINNPDSLSYNFYSAITELLRLTAISEKYGASTDKTQKMLDLIHDIEISPLFQTNSSQELQSFLRFKKDNLSKEFKEEPVSNLLDSQHSEGVVIIADYYNQEKNNQEKSKNNLPVLPQGQAVSQVQLDSKRIKLFNKLETMLTKYQIDLSKASKKTDVDSKKRITSKIEGVTFMMDEITKGNAINKKFFYNYLYAEWGNNGIFEKRTLGRTNRIEKFVDELPSLKSLNETSLSDKKRSYLDEGRVNLLKELDSIEKKSADPMSNRIRTLIASGDAFDKNDLSNVVSTKNKNLRKFIEKLPDKLQETLSIDEVRKMREEKSRKQLIISRIREKNTKSKVIHVSTSPENSTYKTIHSAIGSPRKSEILSSDHPYLNISPLPYVKASVPQDVQPMPEVTQKVLSKVTEPTSNVSPETPPSLEKIVKPDSTTEKKQERPIEKTGLFNKKPVKQDSSTKINNATKINKKKPPGRGQVITS
jgi:hypothetical protein